MYTLCTAHDTSIIFTHLFVYPDHVVDFFHVLFVLVGVGHVLADVEHVPEPAEPEVSAERAPPQHALQVPAQVEMVQAADAAYQPQQIRERLALVVIAVVAAVVLSAITTAVPFELLHSDARSEYVCGAHTARVSVTSIQRYLRVDITTSKRIISV